MDTKIKLPKDLLDIFNMVGSKYADEFEDEKSATTNPEDDDLVNLVKSKRAEREKAKMSEEDRRIEEITSMDLPNDFENIFTLDERAAGVHTDSVDQGLIYSLSNLGRVDIEYISAITGLEYKEVITSLRGSIFQNPLTWQECFYKGWETADV